MSDWTHFKKSQLFVVTCLSINWLHSLKFQPVTMSSNSIFTLKCGIFRVASDLTQNTFNSQNFTSDSIQPFPIRNGRLPTVIVFTAASNYFLASISAISLPKMLYDWFGDIFSGKCDSSAHWQWMRGQADTCNNSMDQNVFDKYNHLIALADGPLHLSVHLVPCEAICPSHFSHLPLQSNGNNVIISAAFLLPYTRVPNSIRQKWLFSRY